MLFNSYPFLLFFIVVFIIYYLPPVRKRAKLQNWWLLLASFFFYGYANMRMVPLLIITTAVFYWLAIWLKSEMDKGNDKNASRITTLGVVIGIGVLFYFKYLGFFVESFAKLLNGIGFSISWSTLNIIMPIGVSFFTFKLISYVIEVHREHIEPCHNAVKFATFVAFFPTILSGPIDRPNMFIPQLDRNHEFDEVLAFDGARQLLWGLFTKLCIADTLATLTDSAWSNIGNSTSSTLVLAVILYPIQIYADFDGYSNMAIGVSKILGIKVARNFNHPFLARNIAEFWRNWHMSLTGWLTDYVFSPLNIAFRNIGNMGLILAIVINFILIGFWHGANWTFGLFGLYHGLLYIPLILSGAFGKKKKLKATNKGLPYGNDVFKMIGTYILVAISFILFRANNLSDAFEYIISSCSTSSLFVMPQYLNYKILFAVLFAIIILVLEWIQRDKEYSYQLKEVCQRKRTVLDVLLVFVILLFGSFGGNQFIYFQF